MDKSLYYVLYDYMLIVIRGIVMVNLFWCHFQKATKAAAVDRLTDTSKYTGTHKERFDESGKGKGKAGREEIADTSGYVSAYKGSGTYDEKVKNA